MTDANINNSRKMDKATALLALNADKSKKHQGQGPCLLPEEMAALVDNTCAKEQRAVFLDHLSRCETCYGEWLTLKKLDDRQAGRGRKRGRLYRLSKIQKYSFIGSALAVAASVAVYLNIAPLPDTFLDSLSEESALVQPDSRPAAPTLTMEKEEIKSKEASEKSVPMASETTAPPSKAVQTLQTSPELPGTAKKMARSESAGAAGAPVDADSWLAQVEEHCRAGNQDARFWAKMHLQGKTMLAQQAGLLPRDTEEKMSAALGLLGEMDGADVTGQCRLLLQLLAEDGNSRQDQRAP